MKRGNRPGRQLGKATAEMGMGLVGLQNSEEARGVCWSAGSTIRTRVPHPSLQACNRQTSLLCQRRNSSHRAVESMGPVLEVAKQPKSWKGLRGHSELAVTLALPLRRDLFILLSAPWGPGNQYSPSNTYTHLSLPQLAYTLSSWGTFYLSMPLSFFGSSGG